MIRKVKVTEPARLIWLMTEPLQHLSGCSNTMGKCKSSRCVRDRTVFWSCKLLMHGAEWL
jgi:hypothetical protein